MTPPEGPCLGCMWRTPQAKSAGTWAEPVRHGRDFSQHLETLPHADLEKSLRLRAGLPHTYGASASSFQRGQGPAPVHRPPHTPASFPGAPSVPREGQWGRRTWRPLWRLLGWRCPGRQVWLGHGAQHGQPVPTLGLEPGLIPGKGSLVPSALGPSNSRLVRASQLPPSSSFLGRPAWIKLLLGSGGSERRWLCALSSSVWTRPRAGGRLLQQDLVPARAESRPSGTDIRPRPASGLAGVRPGPEALAGTRACWGGGMVAG